MAKLRLTMIVRRRTLATVLTVLMLVWSAGHPTSLEAAGDELVPPRLDLPFADGATWIVAAPAEGRRPDRATAWAVNFKPAGEASVDADDTIVAPVAGRVRLLDVRPPIVPVWCKYDGVWVGPQHEVAIDIDDAWTVLLGALDDLAVGDRQEVDTGQTLGTLSRSTCDGERALELLFWHRGEGGVRSHPIGSLGGYRDEELTPGRSVIGAPRLRQ